LAAARVPIGARGSAQALPSQGNAPNDGAREAAAEPYNVVGAGGDSVVGAGGSVAASAVPAAKQPRGPVKCGRCGGQGHNARNAACPLLNPSPPGENQQQSAIVHPEPEAKSSAQPRAPLPASSTYNFSDDEDSSDSVSTSMLPFRQNKQTPDSPEVVVLD
jgi:hypothetical protein